MGGVAVLLGGCQVPPPHMTASPPLVTVPAPAAADRKILLTVQFGLDKYSIRSDSLPTLYSLATALKDERLRGVSYEINGHTDLKGSFAHNIALSPLRAKSVSDFLRSHGVKVPPIRAQGFGPLQLLYPTDPFNPNNRRVEVVAVGP
jgi:outer membrane protein OmpA-like peptidoglycan-associated protein